MKGSLKLKLFVSLVTLVMMAGAVVMPFVGSMKQTHAATLSPLDPTPTYEPAKWTVQEGILKIVEVGEKSVKADFIVSDGFKQGDTWIAIYQIDGEKLNFCSVPLPVEVSAMKLPLPAPWLSTASACVLYSLIVPLPWTLT